MKLKNLFVTLGLTLAVGIGVAVGVGGKKESKVVKATGFEEQTIYLRPGSNWMKLDDFSVAPRFAVYFSDGGANNEWVDMAVADAGNHVFSAVVPTTHEYNLLIFCRMNGSTTENNWSNRYNQSKDVTSIGASKLFVVQDESWDTATYDDWHGLQDWYIEGTFTEPAYAQQAEYKLAFNAAKYQYELKGVSIPQGKSFYVHSTVEGYKRNAQTETNDASLFALDDPNTRTLKETAYDFYYKPFDGKVWIEENAEIAATTYANAFLGATFDVCNVGEPTDDHSAGLAAIWNAKETPDGTSLVERWNALSIGAKGVFAAGTANATVASAKARYLIIMERYSGVLTAFENGPVASSVATVNTVSNQNNNTIMLVVIISSIALVSVGGFFLLKKKREN